MDRCEEAVRGCSHFPHRRAQSKTSCKRLENERQESILISRHLQGVYYPEKTDSMVAFYHTCIFFAFLIDAGGVGASEGVGRTFVRTTDEVRAHVRVISPGSLRLTYKYYSHKYHASRQ